MNFSILMSIYFKENPAFFNQAMQSIWDNQTLKPNEIILVEDGSLTDELYDVIKLWKLKIPDILNIISLPKNVGTGQAKNIGLNACSNEIIAIMDTDDIAIPERFEKQINFLINNPDIAVVGGQIYEFENNIKNIIGSRILPLKNEELKQFAKKRAPINHPTSMYRKSIIEKIGGYQHHLLMEDYNLLIRVINAGYQIENMPETLVYMRSKKAMLGRRRGIQYINSEWQLFKLKLNLNFQNPIFAFGYFIIRSVPRLLPSFLLAPIYKIIRKT